MRDRMPAVLFPDADAGVTITAGGVLHRITVRTDSIAGEPRISHQQSPVFGKTGTCVKVDWPAAASCQQEVLADDFSISRLCQDFASANPHAAISFNGKLIKQALKIERWAASGEATSPHWYDWKRLTLRRRNDEVTRSPSGVAIVALCQRCAIADTRPHPDGRTAPMEPPRRAWSQRAV